ncbi:hypothetical protein SteCoe_8258 [Stentor coeruleus]|uniref:Calcium uniporter protein C-terminal domain-containing protein n=1 Tax=Stentor coeruleus TaxID=5963 RepID=A0A1R2CKR6_9CILI|nr:hypothetical protein SteCoe_8258 [Stentor coeruleus]
MLVKRLFSLVSLNINNNGVTIPVHGSPIFIPFHENTTIGTIYDYLKIYENTKIESLEGVLISKSTKISELQGVSFIIRIGSLNYKIDAEALSTSIKKHLFLLNCHEMNPSKQHIVHKYIQKLDKIAKSGEMYKKEHLEILINDIVLKKNKRDRFDALELNDKIHYLFSEIQRLKPEFEVISKKADFKALSFLWGGFFITVTQMLYIGIGSYYTWSWDVMEAQAYLIGLANLSFGTWYSLSSKVEFENTAVYNRLYLKYLEQYSEKSNFDLKGYMNLQEEFAKMQRQITSEEVE